MCVCVRAHVDMENRRREEFGVAVAHFFFPFSSVFPLSLRCCQSPWGRISAAAIGRPRLSKYTFNFLRLCRLALFSFSLCCVGSPGPWVGESLWVLASGSGLLKKKKMHVIYWEKYGSLSNWSESSRPKEFGGKMVEGGGVGFRWWWVCKYSHTPGTWCRREARDGDHYKSIVCIPSRRYLVVFVKPHTAPSLSCTHAFRQIHTYTRFLPPPTRTPTSAKSSTDTTTTSTSSPIKKEKKRKNPGLKAFGMIWSAMISENGLIVLTGLRWGPVCFQCWKFARWLKLFLPAGTGAFAGLWDRCQVTRHGCCVDGGYMRKKG